MSRKIDYRAGVGYFGIGVENGKTIANLGTIWRSAVNLGASFTFQIGDRYKRQCSDTRVLPAVCHCRAGAGRNAIGIDLYQRSVTA